MKESEESLQFQNEQLRKKLEQQTIALAQKNHELEIEAALERVRARAMAMQNSEELNELIGIVFKELTKLDFALTRCVILIYDPVTYDVRWWMANSEAPSQPMNYFVKHHEMITPQKYVQAWLARDLKWQYQLQGSIKTEWDDFLFTKTELSQLPDFVIAGMKGPDSVWLSSSFNNFGCLTLTSLEPLSDEHFNIMLRFAKVFDLTYTRFRDLQKAELDLTKFKEEKKRTEDALNELQATQKQLIQSEKMASLGELTAGIAHEIQNPLNFVNNFSEVSTELVDEMNEEIQKGNMENAQLIASDLKDNLAKINHHGKRAGDIVKSMLQHSRNSNGQKELADINALCDEYLRLAYHGLRAKDKSFNATMKTDFDESIGSINIISQDMGRVILNLITNAFYAVADKKKKGMEGYEPTVTVTTRKNGNKIMVTVRDNGMGIPQNIKDKVFQPFFTTKPIGEGTGLGLSMSYDIITKGHGGEFSVATQEGEYAEFTILLPL